MSGVCAVAVGALAGLIGLKVSFAAPPRAPKKRQPRNGVTERERPRCFCEPLGAEPMSIRSRLPRASVAKGPPGISFHSSEAADHLNCTRVSTGHWCGTGLKKAHLSVRVFLARLLTGGALCRGSANPLGFSPALLRGGAGLRTDRSTSQPHIHPVYIYSRCKYREATSAGRRTRLSSNSSSNLD